MNLAIKPLSGHAVLLLLAQLAVLLLAARLAAEGAKRLGLPAVVGELAAGIALGATGLGRVAPGAFAALFPPVAAQFHLLEVVGTLGMVLLLLLTGLETDLRLLRNLGRAAGVASLMGMVVPFAFGFGLGLFMPERYLAQPEHRLLFSSFLATAMAISAMPVIAKILMDLDLTRRNIGLIILSAGVVDDTAGWLILSVIAGAASLGTVRIGGLLVTLLLTVGFVVAAALVIYPLARLLSRVARRFRTGDTDLVFLLVVTFLCAAATEAIGIHAVFGAFVAGTLFRQVPDLREDTVHRLESFVFSVLAPIFFGIVGLKVNLWAMGGGAMLAIVLAIACLGKLVGCTIGSIWGGLRFWEGLSIAVAMNARGAMELVVASIGLSLGILNQEMFSIIVMVAVVTSFMAPIGLRLTMRKVRMTEEEARRMVAERAKGAFDPERVRVLLPTAGGPNGLAAAQLAAGVAQRSAHRVNVMRVITPETLTERIARWVTRSDRGVGEEGVALSAQLATAGLDPTFRDVKSSAVAKTILLEARNADLMVMGASRHAGWVGGDVLEEVVREAPCHLAIVRAADEPRPYKSVLAAYDGGVFSRVAVEFAARFAAAAGASLTVAVLSETAPWGGDDERKPGNGETSPADSGESLARISPVFQTLDLAPRVLSFVHHPLVSPVVAEAASGRYDLVVIGAENRAIEHRLFFGRESERLLRETKATVVVLVPSVAQLK